jgi:hypothetical protein
LRTMMDALECGGDWTGREVRMVVVDVWPMSLGYELLGAWTIVIGVAKPQYDDQRLSRLNNIMWTARMLQKS